jgi:ADP-heptose:LPS heptosyltransferase
MNRVAVFRALQLGDLLCAVPAFRALRVALPDAHIALVGLPWAADFARRFARYIDEFIEFPGHPDLPERRDGARLPAFLAGMRARQFDLAVQMHGNGRITNPLVAQFGALQVSGFAVPGEHTAVAGCFVDWRAREHEIDRCLRLTRALGAASCGRALEFPLGQADLDELVRLENKFGFDAARTVCVHPGAQLASRRWRPGRFAEVAEAIAERGWQVVLTGTAGEAVLCEQVARSMAHPAIVLAGQTSLGAVAALISRARLLVSNDTGVSHLAAAFGTASVVVCSGADPQRWAPLDRRRHHVLWHPVRCRPCAHAHCPQGRPDDHPCADGVAAASVRAEALELLKCAA